MKDIVERLRNSRAYIPEYDFHGNASNVDDEDNLYQDAADEIERLRKALRDIQDAGEHYPAGYFKQRALFALKG